MDIGHYIVMCREDSKPDGTPGKYVFATSQKFTTFSLAKKFANSVSSTRKPRILLTVPYDHQSK